jgi:hypothetical protein
MGGAAAGFLGASGLAGIKGGAGYLAGAGIGAAGLTVGAAGLAGLGVLGYYGLKNYSATQTGRGLDAQIEEMSQNRAAWNRYAPYRDSMFAVGNLGIQSARAAGVAGAGGMSLDAYNRGNASRDSALVRETSRVRNEAVGGDPQEQQAAQQALLAIERQRMQLAKEKLQVNERSLSQQRQENEELIRGLELSRRDAMSASSDYGRLGRADRAKLNRLVDRPLNERRALEIEKLTGRREGSPQSNLLDRLGQQGFDADPSIRAAYGSSAKTSGELEAITKQIKDATAAQSRIEASLTEIARTVFDAIARHEAEILALSADVQTLTGSQVRKTKRSVR